MTRPTRVGEIHKYIMQKDDGSRVLTVQHEIMIRAFAFKLPWSHMEYTPPEKEQDQLWEQFQRYLNEYDDKLQFNMSGISLTWIAKIDPEKPNDDGYITVEERPPTDEELTDETIGIFPEDNSKPTIRWPDVG